MPTRYVNGFVSRFSAGGKAFWPPADRQAATSLLQRSGVSPPGIRQFLAGEPVANAFDRYKLAGIVGDVIDLTQAPPGGPVAPLLVPAVQMARYAARRGQKLQDYGLSAAGAQRFVAGLPINDADDRQTLPQLFIAALRGARPALGGGYNQMTLDDTRGKEK